MAFTAFYTEFSEVYNMINSFWCDDNIDNLCTVSNFPLFMRFFDFDFRVK